MSARARIRTLSFAVCLLALADVAMLAGAALLFLGGLGGRPEAGEVGREDPRE